MENAGLTKRETQIMNVLWQSDKPLSAHDVLEASPELSRNTIQIVLKKLQTIGFIEVAGFGYNKNALTRTFRPVISQAKYMYNNLAQDTLLTLALNFIDDMNDEEILDTLEDKIQEKRKAMAEAR